LNNSSPAQQKIRALTSQCSRDGLADVLGRWTRKLSGFVEIPNGLCSPGLVFQAAVIYTIVNPSRGQTGIDSFTHQCADGPNLFGAATTPGIEFRAGPHAETFGTDLTR